MAATRSSQGSAKSSQASTKSTPQNSASKAGAKRKSVHGNDTTSPAPRKRGRPSKKDKEQKTLEETMNDKADENGETKEDQEDETMKDVESLEDDGVVTDQIDGKSHGNDDSRKENGENEVEKSTKDNENKTVDPAAENETSTSDNKISDGPATNGTVNSEKNAFDEVKADTDDVKKTAHEEQDTKIKENSTNNESIMEDSAREATIPSSILEKGIIYFFFRSRVNITEPQGIEDIARSYLVLRPLPLGTKLGNGPLQDLGNARLIALPKKMLPKSGQDRFLTFVDNAKSSIKDLRDQFAGNEYATKTQGTSNTQPATPFAEGVYAITSTGRESHIAYYLTMPSPDKLGDIQHELGLAEKGSFIASVKNPKAPGPANASINDPAEYPTKIQNKFGNLRWSPLEPEMLDYTHTQMLLIGEDRGDLEKSVKEMGEDKKDDEKVSPEEEMNQLEKEDHDRVKHLKEDDPVFADLGLSSKEYPHLKTTW